MYGAPLTVPGDFITNHGNHSDHGFQLQRLRDTVGSLAPTPTSRHGAVPVSVPADLQRAKFVFVRRDAHRTCLQQPYKGPYRVIESGPKMFKLDMGGKTETITVDRLKLAHLDVDSPVQLALPRPRGQPSPVSTPPIRPTLPHLPQRTRSGRQVRPTKRYFSVLGGACSGLTIDIYQTSCCVLLTFT